MDDLINTLKKFAGINPCPSSQEEFSKIARLICEDMGWDFSEEENRIFVMGLISGYMASQIYEERNDIKMQQTLSRHNADLNQRGS